MADGHCLKVLDEEPACGKERLEPAWRGYFEAFPCYLIYPERIAVEGATVSVLGTTTRSHLGLPDEVESKLNVIWIADVQDGLLASWTIIEDTAPARRRFGLE
jgi:hypothetical protein